MFSRQGQEFEMLVFVVAFLFTSAWAYEDLTVDLGDDPMENPDLFEGDILGIDLNDDRNVISKLERRWPGGVVPFEMDKGLKPYTKTIFAAMDDYHKNTCIRFKKRTDEKNYVRLFPGKGCNSHVGMSGGKQVISLGKGCIHLGTIVHELGHALGFFHEQNRSDRDKYLIIYWDNIERGKERQFARRKPSQNLLLEIFDYNSIMLYGETTFSKDGVAKTMVAKTGVRLIKPRHKPGLSSSDIKSLRKMYNCKKKYLSYTHPF